MGFFSKLKAVVESDEMKSLTKEVKDTANKTARQIQESKVADKVQSNKHVKHAKLLGSAFMKTMKES